MFCSHDSSLATLRTRLADLGGLRPDEILFTGLATLDSRLPGGGLACGALHEFASEREADGAATALLAFLAGRLAEEAGSPILWVTRRDDLFPPGILRFGCPAHRLLLVRCRTRPEVLWAMEEGLRSPAVAGVVGDTESLNFTWSRRLQLAARRARRPALLLRDRAAPLEASAAATRWRVVSVPSAPGAGGGPGAPRWHLELVRCRGGAPRNWRVGFDASRGVLAESPGFAKVAPGVAETVLRGRR